MSPLIAVFAIFFISVQGFESGLQESLKKDHDDLVSEVKDWLAGTIKDFQSDVDGQVENLKTVVETSHKDGEQRIHNMYDTSVRKLRGINAPKVCLKNAELQLLAGKAANLQNFFTCSNITAAGKDILLIVYEAGKLVSELLLSADDLLNGLGNCWSWNPINVISCTYKWVKAVIKDVFGTFSDLKNFTTKVSDLITDIKKQIDFCVNKGNDQLHNDMLNSLTDINQCSIKMKSVQ